MHHTPKIGIIGGAGVAAGAELVARLERLVTEGGAFRDAHHPETILFQATQVPSRSLFLEGRGGTFVPGYIDVGIKLKQAGATFVAMCCNTAHSRWSEIQAGVGLPFINLIEETVRAALATAPGARRIGVICSDGTRIAKLYEETAKRLDPKTSILQPNALFQAKVTRGICNVKKGFHRSKSDSDPERPMRLYREAAGHLIENGADIVVLGCTEVPLDFGMHADYGCPIIDCIEVLARCCLSLHQAQSQGDGSSSFASGTTPDK